MTTPHVLDERPASCTPDHTHSLIEIEWGERIYDGALWCECDECGARWHRHADPALRALAEQGATTKNPENNHDPA